MPPTRPANHIDTLAAHASRLAVPANQPAAPAIYQAAGWEFDDLDQSDRIFEEEIAGVKYGALGGAPNQGSLERIWARLHGADSVTATTGGMSALLATFLGLLTPGSRVVAARDLFGMTVAQLAELERWGVETVYVDTSDLDAVQRELSAGARMLLVETISNPLTRVPDLPGLARLAQASAALLVVDNTFASPLHCRPLAHGADLVVESITKSLAGHHDVLLGAVGGRAELLDPIRAMVVKTSNVPSPFAAWLGVRGIVSYPLRQRQAAANALRLATWLREQDDVLAVHYPGLAGHPDRGAARTILDDGHGAVLSIELAHGRRGIDALARAMPDVRLVMSLGGPATTIAHPASMTHRMLDRAAREALGIHDGLLRIAVGIEHVDDVIESFRRGLAAVRCLPA